MTDPTLATRPLPDGVTAVPVWGARLRADGTPAERVSLRWTWEGGRRPGSLIMTGLNPSGAAADVADATLIRVRGYARREGFGSLLMLNAFPTRARYPKDLIGNTGDPNYPFELARLIESEPPESILVAGWGSQSGAVGRLVRERVAALLPLVSRPWHSLGVTADGSPRHPLYVRGDVPLAPWVAPG